MSNDGDYVERTVETPAGVRREEVRVVRSNNTGWWIALAVAIVATVGALFWYNASQNSSIDLQAARDEGAAQASLADAAANAQASAAQAAQAAQTAATTSTQVTESAARSAAANATTAARDAAASEPAEPPPPSPQ